MSVASFVHTVRGRVRRRGVRATTKRVLQRSLRIPIVFAASRMVRRRIRNITSIDEALDVAYGFSFGGVVFEPWQERSEIGAFLELIATVRPRTILEIGTSYGGSLFLLARVAAPDALIVTIDLPRGEFGGGYPPWRGHLYRSFAGPRQRIRLLRADSHRAATLEAARAALEHRPVDVLFIDGDHAYDGVKHDFEMYGRLVRTGGVIALHDIVPAGPDGPRPRNFDDLRGGDVPRLWGELRGQYGVTEFVDDWDSGRFGIGAIVVS